MQHRLLYCGLIVLGFWSLAYLLPLRVQAQGQLPEVAIVGEALQADSHFHFREEPDTLLQRALQNQDLAQVLEYGTLSPVRNYGPSQISTISSNGLSAQHAPLRWGNMNWQNPQLGQTDYSLIPIYLLGSSTLHHGAAGSMGGNALTGGYVDARPSKQVSRSLFFQKGSFGNQSGGLRYGLQEEAHQAQAQLYGCWRRNHFPIPTEEGTQRLDNAQNQHYGGSASWQWQAKDALKLEVQALHVQALREIPKFHSLQGAQEQKDRQSGLHLGYATRWGKWKSRGSLGLMNHYLAYKDTLSGIHSRSHVGQVKVQQEFSRKWGSHWTFSTQLGLSHFLANSNLYKQQVQETRPFAAVQGTFKPYEHLVVQAGLRQGMRDKDRLPPMGHVSATYQLHPHLGFFAKASRLYRLPTFNDRFWPGSGKPHLDPEQGWSTEAGLKIDKRLFDIDLSGKMGVFSNQLKQAIVWMPGEEVWEPFNLQQLNNAGLHFQASLSQSHTNTQWKIEGGYGYVHSQTRQAGQEFPSLFIPQETARLLARISHRGLYALYAHKWTGFQYTARDQSQWLPNYQTGMLRIGYQRKWKTQQYRLYTGLDNCWNAQYESVPGRPMPPRAFSIGLQIDLP